jgi:hypothetical protein
MKSIIMPDEQVIHIPQAAPEDLANELEQVFLGGAPVEYRYSNYTSYRHNDDKAGSIVDDYTKDHPQFVHTAYNEQFSMMSGYNFLIRPLMQLFKENIGDFSITVSRIKINLVPAQPNYPEGFYSCPHIDSHYEDNEYVFLYYINDSDGDTIFFNEFCGLAIDGKDDTPALNPDKLTVQKRISPKKGSAAFFKANKFHTGEPPRNTNTRAVINFVMRIEDGPNARPIA